MIKKSIYRKGEKGNYKHGVGRGEMCLHRVIKRQTESKEGGGERLSKHVASAIWVTVIWNPLNLAAFSAAVSRLDVGGRSRQ